MYTDTFSKTYYKHKHTFKNKPKKYNLFNKGNIEKTSRCQLNNIVNHFNKGENEILKLNSNNNIQNKPLKRKYEEVKHSSNIGNSLKKHSFKSPVNFDNLNNSTTFKKNSKKEPNYSKEVFVMENVNKSKIRKIDSNHTSHSTSKNSAKENIIQKKKSLPPEGKHLGLKSPKEEGSIERSKQNIIIGESQLKNSPKLIDGPEIKLIANADIKLNTMYSPNEEIVEQETCVLDFEPPYLHKIGKLVVFSNEEKQHLIDLGVENRVGIWSQAEMDILERNWKNFLKEHKDANYEFLLGFGVNKAEQMEKKALRAKFIKATQFYYRLGRDLNTRSLLAIYKKARDFLCPYKRTKIDNEIKKKIMKLHSIHGNNHALIAGTCKITLSKVSNFIADNSEGRNKGAWTSEEQKNLIKIIKKVMNIQDISNLPKEVSWTKIAKYIPSRNRNQCRNQWLRMVPTKKINNNLNHEKFTLIYRLKLIYLIYHSKIKDEREFNWVGLENNFNNIPSYIILQRNWTKLKKNVPDYENKSHSDIIKYLYQTYLTEQLQKMNWNEEKLKEFIQQTSKGSSFGLSSMNVNTKSHLTNTSSPVDSDSNDECVIEEMPQEKQTEEQKTNQSKPSVKDQDTCVSSSVSETNCSYKNRLPSHLLQQKNALKKTLKNSRDAKAMVKMSKFKNSEISQIASSSQTKTFIDQKTHQNHKKINFIDLTDYIDQSQDLLETKKNINSIDRSFKKILKDENAKVPQKSLESRKVLKPSHRSLMNTSENESCSDESDSDEIVITQMKSKQPQTLKRSKEIKTPSIKNVASTKGKKTASSEESSSLKGESSSLEEESSQEADSRIESENMHITSNPQPESSRCQKVKTLKRQLNEEETSTESDENFPKSKSERKAKTLKKTVTLHKKIKHNLMETKKNNNSTDHHSLKKILKDEIAKVPQKSLESRKLLKASHQSLVNTFEDESCSDESDSDEIVITQIMPKQSQTFKRSKEIKTPSIKNVALTQKKNTISSEESSSSEGESSLEEELLSQEADSRIETENIHVQRNEKKLMKSSNTSKPQVVSSKHQSAATSTGWFKTIPSSGQEMSTESDDNLPKSKSGLGKSKNKRVLEKSIESRKLLKTSHRTPFNTLNRNSIMAESHSDEIVVTKILPKKSPVLQKSKEFKNCSSIKNYTIKNNKAISSELSSEIESSSQETPDLRKQSSNLQVLKNKEFINSVNISKCKQEKPIGCQKFRTLKKQLHVRSPANTSENESCSDESDSDEIVITQMKPKQSQTFKRSKEIKFPSIKNVAPTQSKNKDSSEESSSSEGESSSLEEEPSSQEGDLRIETENIHIQRNEKKLLKSSNTLKPQPESSKCQYFKTLKRQIKEEEMSTESDENLSKSKSKCKTKALKKTVTLHKEIQHGIKYEKVDKLEEIQKQLAEAESKLVHEVENYRSLMAEAQKQCSDLQKKYAKNKTLLEHSKNTSSSSLQRNNTFNISKVHPASKINSKNQKHALESSSASTFDDKSDSDYDTVFASTPRHFKNPRRSFKAQYPSSEVLSTNENDSRSDDLRSKYQSTPRHFPKPCKSFKIPKSSSIILSTDESDSGIDDHQVQKSKYTPKIQLKNRPEPPERPETSSPEESDSDDCIMLESPTTNS